MDKTIAFFDFDGTITRKDTMLEMIRFVKGNNAFYAGMLQLSPWLMAMKAGIISNEKAKEKMLSLFFKGMKMEEFNHLCKQFTQEIIPGLIRPDAAEAIASHQFRQHEVVVVTASAENWVEGFCKEHSLKLIGTHLATDPNGMLTGKLKSANCNGQEKVNRIKLMYDPAEYSFIYCYGDSDGDKELLSIATHPFYKHFKG